MLVFHNLTEAPAKTAVALGYFDGVHLGHRSVLKAAADCKAQGLMPAVFTFKKTPKQGTEYAQLTTPEEKAEIFEKLGIEILYIIDFETVKNKTPEEFIGTIVKKVFKAEKVFCGFNYHFGKSGTASIGDLAALCEKYGIKATVSERVTLDGESVSSSAIRQNLREGKIELANKMLGYDFGIISTSVEGNHIGSSMNTPTINLRFEENRLLPMFGVYASVVIIDGKKHIGVTNIGVKPTFGDNNPPNCETWMPLYSGGELYGKRVEVRLKKFIRRERKFSGMDELKHAIERDGRTAVELLMDKI